MYAIRNRKTKKGVYGTDYRMHHPRMKKRESGPKFFSYEQRTSFHKALIFGDRKEAELEFDIRGCGHNYEIVEVYLYAKDDLIIGGWQINNSAVKGELYGRK